MAVTTEQVELTDARLAEIQALLRELDLDGWLLYDFRGTNPIAASILGLPQLTRRVFVLIPSAGEPIAVTHRIEQQPWSRWGWENRAYLGWESLHENLTLLVAGRSRLAMEYSPGDGVPYLDRVPAGVLDLVRSSGANPVSSADLVSALHSRWSTEGLASHRRSARVLRASALAAFEAIARAAREGRTVTDWGVREQILSRLHSEGLTVGTDAVVAVNANAANPHYAPSATASTAIREGDVVLIDLWGKEPGAHAVYADQTWMAFHGADVPERVESAWRAVRDARNAAVDLLRARHSTGAPVAGAEVDDVARAIISDRGYGHAFIHRTGHSIDRELHGSGPNLDNLETRDERRLITGVGFSIEPGIYLPGEYGIRSEIDVFMGPDGPDITTPLPQESLYRIGVDPAD